MDTIQIKVTICGQDVSMDEARKIYAQLKDLFELKGIFEKRATPDNALEFAKFLEGQKKKLRDAFDDYRPNYNYSVGPVTCEVL